MARKYIQKGLCVGNSNTLSKPVSLNYTSKLSKPMEIPKNSQILSLNVAYVRDKQSVTCYPIYFFKTQYPFGFLFSLNQMQSWNAYFLPRRAAIVKWDKYYIPTLSAKSKHFCLCLASSIPEKYVGFFPCFNFTSAAVNNINSTDIFFYSHETQHSDVCSSTDLTFQKVCIRPSLYFRGERSSVCGHKIDLLLVNKNLRATTQLIKRRGPFLESPETFSGQKSHL